MPCTRSQHRFGVPALRSGTRRASRRRAWRPLALRIAFRVGRRSVQNMAAIVNAPVRREKGWRQRAIHASSKLSATRICRMMHRRCALGAMGASTVAGDRRIRSSTRRRCFRHTESCEERAPSAGRRWYSQVPRRGFAGPQDSHDVTVAIWAAELRYLEYLARTTSSHCSPPATHFCFLQQPWARVGAAATPRTTGR